MDPELRKKIEELIALDKQRQMENAKKYPSGLTIGPGGNADGALKDILGGRKSPILEILERMTPDDLAVVMALMWFGRGDGIAEPGATFQSVLEHAKTQLDDMAPNYVYEKPLSTYLPRGLERLGVK